MPSVSTDGLKTIRRGGLAASIPRNGAKALVWVCALIRSLKQTVIGLKPIFIWLIIHELKLVAIQINILHKVGY
ncbi:MAG: hypothetical protein K8H86_09490 [Ignavibacteriaceae bacterium]|nr:hypothetical protein [Ignavibacteriaceae bacterium]